MKRLALLCALLLSGVLALTLVGAPGAGARSIGGPGVRATSAPDDSAQRADARAATAPTVSSVVRLSAWRACSDPYLASYDLECARLTVPLAYERPGRGTISLAVTRREHSPARRYQGVMLTNPGGPGGSGTWMPALADYIPGGAGDGYDWIGFDPRGVGASRPALRCQANYFRTDRPNYVPRTARVMRAWLLRTRNYARACGSSAAARLLPHLTTRDTVRDMESLRRALQQERPSAGPKLNFYGYSYGSYLGQVYANRYPARVGRFVLDGVVDPTKVWYQANLVQEKAFNRNLNLWFRYLARNHASFRLGNDWKQVRAGYYKLLTKLDRKPSAGGRLGPSELNDALVNVGYSATSWMELGYQYADLKLRGRGAGLLATYLRGDAADDNGYAVYNAVQCSDVRWPAWRQQRDQAQRWHRYWPFLTWNNTWYNAPCRVWPAPHASRIPVRDKGIDSTILLVNETLDAATPYAGALKVRSLFPTARLIAGKGGVSHASSLSGVSCVDNAIAAYLRTGKAPARRPVRGADLTCGALAPDQPAPGRRSTDLGLPHALQQRLRDAQRPAR